MTNPPPSTLNLGTHPLFVPVDISLAPKKSQPRSQDFIWGGKKGNSPRNEVEEKYSFLNMYIFISVVALCIVQEKTSCVLPSQSNKQNQSIVLLILIAVFQRAFLQLR